MKGYCISCAYFREIKRAIGYCNVLGVVIEKDVAILDTKDTLTIVTNIEDEKIYAPIIVQAYFGCPLFEDKNVKLQIQ